jgi:type IV secretion system protein VirD4
MDKLVIFLGIVLVLLAGCAVGAQYVGALVFVRLEHLPDSAVRILTLHDYWAAYGSVKAVKQALVLSTAVTIVISAFPLVIAAVFIASAGRRALYGDARFARDSDIRKSGLVGARGRR